MLKLARMDARLIKIARILEVKVHWMVQRTCDSRPGLPRARKIARQPLAFKGLRKGPFQSSRFQES